MPTKLVPAIELHDAAYDKAVPGSGELIWESAECLAALDKKFPATPLATPADEAVRGVADAAMASSFSYVFGARNASLAADEVDRRAQGMLDAFTSLDAALASHGGPFMAGPAPGIVDCVCVPMLERYRYQMDLMQARPGYVPPLDSAAFPALARWYAALDGLPAYTDHVAGDGYSWTAVTASFSRQFLSPSPAQEATCAAADAAAARMLGELRAFDVATAARRAAAEAALKLARNHRAIVADAVRADAISQTHLPRVSDPAAVEEMLLAAAQTLLTGKLRLPDGESADGADAALYVASRLCAPRDLGKPAAEALRGVLVRFHAAAGVEC